MENKSSHKRQFRPSAKVQACARYVAKQLNDTKTLPFYIACCNRYPGSCIGKALAKTIKMDLPSAKTRRGYFLKQLMYEYAKESHDRYRYQSRG